MEMIRMNDDIGLAILKQLQVQNKLLFDIYKKDSATLELLKHVIILLGHVHQVDASIFRSEEDEEDSKNE